MPKSDAITGDSQHPRPEPPLYVVGIGASAGGLEAIERFFDNVPEQSGLAFVIVQHLSPDFKSLMDELLARHTKLPIRHVEDGVVVQGGHIYLIPPKKEMIISGGKLLLSERDRKQELTLPIDVFFRSLAQDCGGRAIAVVLSGGGSDGSRGIRDVHDAGGLVVVQNVESAQFDGMPRTARDAGVADWVLPPEEMPGAIVSHVRTRAATPAPRSSDGAPGIRDIYRILEKEFGIDFSLYKPSTVTRRIERRLQLSRVEDIEGYVERLQHRQDELDQLYRDLLIGVTRFFRNEDAFKILEERVLPELLSRGPKDAPFRVWVAGCATGEEVYSLAIVLQELSSRFGNRPVKMFATDVHHGSLAAAAAALYDSNAVANVSPERLDRFFRKHGQGYQVVPELRQMVVFAPHNVVKDPPFTRVDLVTCRNLLIYLQAPAQQKALSLFHFALNRGGVVFLGPSESPGPLLSAFETIDKHWKIYRKFSDVRMPVDTRFHPARPSEPRPSSPAAPLASPGRYPPSQLLGTYDALLEKFMPPSLLVSERGELVHVFGGASRFLKARDGRQGLDLLEVVDPALRMVLVGGMRRALEENTPVVYKGVRVPAEGADVLYRVTLHPLRGRTGPAHLLIALEALGAAPEVPRISEVEVDLGRISREQLVALEAELGHTKENLQAAIEELETSNEELQAANEELLASNEELQSTNEELQSVNEELYTVNAEYQRKIGELVELTNDMDNLLSSTEVGSVFLDGQLRIRKFTPQMAESFNLMPQDLGRPIDTFTHNLRHSELMDDLRSVLVTGSRVERELEDHSGKSFFLRVLPYRARGKTDGVVLTLVDVSGLKAAEDALFHERYLLNSLLASVPDAIYFKDARGRFIRANQAMAERLGAPCPADLTAWSSPDPPNSPALSLHREEEAVLRGGEPQFYRLEERTLPDGRKTWDLSTRLPLVDRSGAVVGIIGIFRDVTAQKMAEEKNKEAVRRRDQFLAMLSHELRNPLSAIVAATALLKRGVPERRGPLLGILDRQSQQMARLLDDLLEVSRVTQNKIELRRELVDVGAVMRDAAEATRALMEERDLSFSMDLDPEPVLVDGDAARLQQIAVNLLHNAAKYTQRGGRVALDARREGGACVIRVRDDGAGIRGDMLETVFEMFVQSDHTLDRSQGGLGVGLMLVRSLVTMHGGEVTVHSEGMGRGSEFVVRLPLGRGRTGAGAAAIAPARLRLSKVKTVVLVEDSADTREMLCEILTLAGFECLAAGDGASALRLVAHVRPDVVLIDIGLPGMDGFELAKRLRELPEAAETFLIALTGYGQPSDRAAAFQAGFDEHLVKPPDPVKLIGLLSGTSLALPPLLEGS